MLQKENISYILLIASEVQARKSKSKYKEKACLGNSIPCEVKGWCCTVLYSTGVRLSYLLSENQQGHGYLQHQHQHLTSFPRLSTHHPFLVFLPFYMPGRFQVSYTCARCLRASRRHNATPDTFSRHFSRASPLKSSRPKLAENEEQASIEAENLEQKSQAPPPLSHNVKKEQGAMSRLLAQATEDAVLEGGRAGRKAVEEAGFSEELKQKLLEKVEAAKFRSENAAAFAGAGVSSNVGRGSEDIAAAQGWTGEENTEDTVLRMLDDARKPLKPGLRGPAKIHSPIVDLRLKRQPNIGPGQRLANARDKTSIYAISKDMQMSDKEREDIRKELKERFTPGARAMPNSIRGLAALANERIEDAIARGQFKVCLLRDNSSYS